MVVLHRQTVGGGESVQHYTIFIDDIQQKALHLDKKTLAGDN